MQLVAINDATQLVRLNVRFSGQHTQHNHKQRGTGRKPLCHIYHTQWQSKDQKSIDEANM